MDPGTERSPAQGAGPVTNALDDVIDSLALTPDELANRFAAQVEAAMRRRQDRRADREDRQARRAAGLVLRHAAKLRRGGGRQ